MDVQLQDQNLTGRYLVTYREDARKAALDELRYSAGVAHLVATSDFTEGLDVTALGGTEGVTFDHLNVAVVDIPPDASARLSLAAGGDSVIESVEPERMVFADSVGTSERIGEAETTEYTIAPSVDGMPVELRPISVEYLRGLRDGIDSILARLLGDQQAPAASKADMEVAAVFRDTSTATWGLQATRAIHSRFTGSGIRVAVLDTGLSTGHPDFRVGPARVRSFISGEDGNDLNGHGTHCAGTVCGPTRPSSGPRYGCAPRADLFVGKVLSNAGSGSDSGILAGIDWALANQCAIVSMSLSGPGPVSPTYEAVGRRALRQNCLIIAAASNTARRPLSFGQVQRPANSGSILAVAAIDREMRIASFSPRGPSTGGDRIDIAGPGVDVYSSWNIRSRLYNVISGTSMATPHVAGIAALWAEATGARGEALWRLLITRARRLSLPAVDVGAGLVQAP
jgi:subtilisin